MSSISHSLLLGLLLLLTACSEPPPLEQAIGHNIAAIQTALEEKNRSAVLEHLDDDFSANRQLDKDAIGVMLLRHFIAHRNIGVSLLSSEISPHPGYTFLAQGRHSVVLTGAENLIPDSARAYEVTTTWKLEGDEWRLYAIDWD